jgi:hypothetical protein
MPIQPAARVARLHLALVLLKTQAALAERVMETPMVQVVVVVQRVLPSVRVVLVALARLRIGVAAAAEV